MKYIPKSIEKAIEAFNKLPGIGSKSAERLVFHLLKKPNQDIQQLGAAISQLKEGLVYCEICKNLCTESRCDICKSDERNTATVCIVEDALDLIALEKTGSFKGLPSLVGSEMCIRDSYHVLHGIISPIDGVGPDELTIHDLVLRAKREGLKEMIFALNPSMEGEATAAYIMRQVEPYNIKVTRIARGIPMGGHVEYADSQTLKRAIEGRMNY